MDLVPIKRALISVTDKTGLEELTRTLVRGNVEIVSTGGTKKRISASGVPVTAVSEVTGFPEILGGRVKTLHPNIHAGVLADKDNPAHLQTLEEHSIKPFDLICVNLYDFARALEAEKPPRELVEEIDIGGPTLLRAGAKNYHSLVVLPSPEFYPAFERECRDNDFRISLDFRRDMAVKTFALISKYDSLIAKGLAK
ncbi:MAG: IMP cyclohydrolase [Thermodesulfobacteriota bacterium]